MVFFLGYQFYIFSDPLCLEKKIIKIWKIGNTFVALLGYAKRIQEILYLYYWKIYTQLHIFNPTQIHIPMNGKETLYSRPGVF